MNIKNFKIFIITVLFVSLAFIVNVNAATYQATITGTGVRLRTGPGTNYGTISGITLSKNGTYKMVDNNLVKSESGCNSGYWYRIYYNEASSGYVCSSYVSVSAINENTNPTNTCEQQLAAEGFPSSYWGGLCALKAAHPNWNFKALLTGLDWSKAVSKESACGTSYIASSVPTNIDSSCKNKYTHTWYPASSTAVAYYMDPRNFFSEKYIFQFEYLKYQTSIGGNYVNSVNAIISGAEFNKYHKSIGNDLGTYINNAGKSINVSPSFIATRILQELGSKNTLYNLYSGVYPGYEKYYNFYNIGVSDSCATTHGATYCGLDYAKRNGWYGLQAAIAGGANQIANNYINRGQFNVYLQKFNVKPNNPDNLYVNQYMTNIAAPSSESSTLFNTYSKLGLLNSAFTFYIPVYNNMDKINYNPNNGASNGGNVGGASSVNIDTIITQSGYRTTGSYLLGVNPDTNVNALKNKIEAISGYNTVVITNRSGSVASGAVGTGFKIKVSNANKSATYSIVINGDTSGDGYVTALDLLQVQKNLLKTYNMSGADIYAADTNDDGYVTALDLLQIQKHILGTYTIRQ